MWLETGQMGSREAEGEEPRSALHNKLSREHE